MAKNYVEQSDMKNAGFQGDDTLYKKNEDEGQEKRSTMSGENVIPQKYGHRDEEVPSQIGDRGYEQRQGDRTNQDDREMRLNNGTNYDEDNALDGDPERQQRGRDAPPDMNGGPNGQRGMDSAEMNGNRNRQRSRDSTDMNADTERQQRSGDSNYDPEMQDEKYHQEDGQSNTAHP